MKHKFTKITLLTAVVAGFTAACNPASENIPTGKRYEFNNILDIAYTPDTLTRCRGWFTDAGSWMGFTLPQKDHWVNGFCGPFSLDMNRRQWMAQSAVTVGYADQANVIFTPDSTCYFPGELYLSASSEEGKIIQRLNFLDASTALLRIHSDAGKELSLTASQWGKEIQVQTDQNTVIARHPSGEIVALTFTPDVSVKGTDNNYQAKINGLRSHFFLYRRKRTFCRITKSTIGSKQSAGRTQSQQRTLGRLSHQDSAQRYET